LAAKGAGFEEISLVDEPTAALLDDLKSANSSENSVDILVYDIGGGTLDVSVVRVEGDGNRTNFSVLAHSPYTELAGTDFDLRIAALLYRILQVEKTSTPKLQDQDKRFVYAWLRQKAEQIKKDLADRLFLSDPMKLSNVIVNIDPFSITYGATDRVLAEFPKFRMSYVDYFEPLFRDFLNHDPEKPRYKTVLTPVLRALEEAYNDNENREKLPLEELVKRIGLVKINGGMGKLPIFEFELRRLFSHLGGDQVKPVPDLMHSVARGATIRHAMNESEGKFGNLQITGDRLFESVFCIS
jgi:molecular chaperone DnaK (HSP70)